MFSAIHTHKAPSVKSNNTPFFQAKLTVNEPGDEYEQEADAVADKVMRMPNPTTISPSNPPDENKNKIHLKPIPFSQISRKCADCEEEEKVQRKESTSGGGQTAPSIVNEVIASSGKSLDGGTRQFMESRMGHDFSHVQVHTDGKAAESATAVNALAYTSGNHIVFNSGQYAPDTEGGKRLLAHELVHVGQQGKSSNQINRTLSVLDPAINIPNPTGTGLVRTNSQTVLDYLNNLCPSGGISINQSGVVAIPPQFCMSFRFLGLSLPSPADISSTPTGCNCLCDIINSPNSWEILIDDSNWPHTSFTSHQLASTTGTGGVVTAPSPNRQTIHGAVTASGGFVDIDPWLILGHELCGHGWLGNQGAHGPDDTPARGRGGHQLTVERENLLRDEHGIARRGTFRQPFCGESFSHPIGTNPTRRTVTMSTYLSACRQWRREYNRLNKTRFTISQDMPIRQNEQLPP